MLRTFAVSVLAFAAAATAAPRPTCRRTQSSARCSQNPHAPPSRTVVVVREVETYDYPIMGFSPPADVRPLVAGYYGRPNSYYYRSYYGSEGGALWDAYSRLPYACGFYGYC